MPVTTQPYDQFKIDKLKNFLQEMTEKGQEKPYEIFVDILKVVPKTEDISQFDAYESYMDEDTQKVRVLIYNSRHSPRNDQYCFLVKSPQLNKGLNGPVEIDAIIQERLEAKEKEHELKDLRKELADIKQLLQEAEDYSDELIAELESVKTGQHKKQLGYGELAGVMLEGFIRRNPKLLERIPGGEALAGFIEQDNLEKSKLPLQTPQVDVSFQPKTTASTPPALNPEYLQYIPVLQQLDNSFNQPDLELVMQVIGRFNEQPTLLNTVADLLNINH